MKLKTIAKILICTSIILSSCTCKHTKDNHIPNDTVKCVVIDDYNDLFYNVVLHRYFPRHIIVVQNTKTYEIRKLVNPQYEMGDTVLEITHYCPYKYCEIVPMN